MNRRSFIKTLFVMIAGLFVFPFVASFRKNEAKKIVKHKGRYYKKLAG